MTQPKLTPELYARHLVYAFWIGVFVGAFIAPVGWMLVEVLL